VKMHVNELLLVRMKKKTTYKLTVTKISRPQARKQAGGIWGICPPPKISKHCIAIWKFAETFKNKDEILYSNHFLEKS